MYVSVFAASSSGRPRARPRQPPKQPSTYTQTTATDQHQHRQQLVYLHSADLKHSLGVPEAGRSNTRPPTWPTLCHHRPAAGTARVVRRRERPTHQLHPAPALAVVFAGSCGIGAPSLAWESNPAKLCGRRVDWADLRRSAYTCPPRPLPLATCESAQYLQRQRHKIKTRERW